MGSNKYYSKFDLILNDWVLIWFIPIDVNGSKYSNPMPDGR